MCRSTAAFVRFSLLSMTAPVVLSRSPSLSVILNEPEANSGQSLNSTSRTQAQNTDPGQQDVQFIRSRANGTETNLGGPSPLPASYDKSMPRKRQRSDDHLSLPPMASTSPSSSDIPPPSKRYPTEQRELPAPPTPVHQVLDRSFFGLEPVDEFTEEVANWIWGLDEGS